MQTENRNGTRFENHMVLIVASVVTLAILIASVMYILYSRSFPLINYQETQTEETSSTEVTDGDDVEVAYNPKFIVTNPLDLSQIKSFSKFRSCQGHDYSGLNVNGQEELERSMKHYIIAKRKSAKVKAIAPFDGKIITIMEEQSHPNKQVWIEGSETGGWMFVFFHLELQPGIEVGAEVEAGDLIGYADFPENPIFDMALQKFTPEGRDMLDEYLGSELDFERIKNNPELRKEAEKVFGDHSKLVIYDTPLNYMSEEVLAEYAKVGVTPTNIVLSKATRDKSPCNWNNLSAKASETIILKNN